MSNLENRFCSSALSHKISKIFSGLQIYKATTHTYRHTFITYCFECGIDTTDIMKWARIKDLRALTVYKHQTRKTYLQNINKIPY